MAGINSFVSYFSGITVLHCFMSKLLKTVFMYLSLSFFFFCISGRRVNPFPDILSWPESTLIYFLISLFFGRKLGGSGAIISRVNLVFVIGICQVIDVNGAPLEATPDDIS